MSFEQDLARLDAIARALESDQLALDEALKLFEEGVVRPAAGGVSALQGSARL